MPTTCRDVSFCRCAVSLADCAITFSAVKARQKKEKNRFNSAGRARTYPPPPHALIQGSRGSCCTGEADTWCNTFYANQRPGRNSFGKRDVISGVDQIRFTTETTFDFSCIKPKPTSLLKKNHLPVFVSEHETHLFWNTNLHGAADATTMGIRR